MLFVDVEYFWNIQGNSKDINLISEPTKIELIINVWNIEITPS